MFSPFAVAVAVAVAVASLFLSPPLTWPPVSRERNGREEGRKEGRGDPLRAVAGLGAEVEGERDSGF